jgi:hypothetical protein
MMRALPALVIALGCAGLLWVTADARAGEGEEPTVALDTAQMELERLENALRSRHAVNDELLGDLSAVLQAYLYLEDPPELKLSPVPDGATPEERESIEDANRDREREWKRAKRRWSRAAKRFRGDAEDAFLDALGEVEIGRDTDRNIREPVNILASRTLAATRNPDLAEGMQRVLEREILDAKHDVSSGLLEEAFANLARLGNHETLEWLVDDFTHTRSTPQSAVEQLRAAHKAILLFKPKKVPGDLRYEVVEQFVRAYSGVESVAEQSSADASAARARIFWNQIRNEVIRILQQFAGAPTDARGAVFGRVEDFQNWFREHKNPRKAPWVDDEESP